jgi:predicted transcriptional regulator
MQILSVLWDKGASTAREVLELMPDGKKRAYTSILSVMQVMEKKGLLKHTNRGVAHVYSPAVSKKKIIQPFIHKVVNEVFGGRPSAMMQALLTQTPVSDDELTQIHKLLEQVKTTKPAKTGKGREK